MRAVRAPGGVKGKPSPTDDALKMPPPPPKHPSRLRETCGTGAAAASSSRSTAAVVDSDSSNPIRRLQKKLREIEAMLASGRPLNEDEQIKAAQKPLFEEQLLLLIRSQPAISGAVTPVSTPARHQGTPLSAASTMPAACAAAAYNTAQDTLNHLLHSPPRRASTRAVMDEARQEMAAVRAALQRARLAAPDAAREA